MHTRALLVGCLTSAAGACATRLPARDVPPLAIAFNVPSDSARGLLLAAMRTERVPIDGDGQIPGRVVTSTYSVRRGGIGESEVRLRFVVEPDASGAALILVEAVGTDKMRSIAMTGDRTAPARRPGPHPVTPDDLEALRPVQRLLRRLETLGGLISRAP